MDNGVHWRSASAAPTTTYTEQLEFDVAEDGTRFVFDEAPVFDDGLPAYGNAFVTQGYIYEAGAIADGAGVNTEAGAWVVSTKIFDFDDQPDTEQVVSVGLELVDHEVAGLRPIVGGTGRYHDATGEQAQVLHGHNDSDGVQLTMTLSIETTSSG